MNQIPLHSRVIPMYRLRGENQTIKILKSLLTKYQSPPLHLCPRLQERMKSSPETSGSRRGLNNKNSKISINQISNSSSPSLSSPSGEDGEKVGRRGLNNKKSKISIYQISNSSSLLERRLGGEARTIGIRDFFILPISKLHFVKNVIM